MSKKKQMHPILGKVPQEEIDAYNAGLAAERREWRDQLLVKLAGMFEVANSDNATGKSGYAYPREALVETLLAEFRPEYLSEDLSDNEKAGLRLHMRSLISKSDLWQLWYVLCMMIQDGETHKLQKFHRAAGMGRVKR